MRNTSQISKHLIVLAATLLIGCGDQKTQELESRTPEELQQIAAKAIHAEKYSKAEAALTAILKSSPSNFETLAGRSAVRILAGDADGAGADFEAMIKLDAEKGAKARFYVLDRTLWRARELDMKGRHPEALKIYDAFLLLEPESGTAYHDRGGLQTAMKNYGAAIADLTKAIQFDDGNNSYGDSYTLRARAKRANGDEAGAAEDEAMATATSEARSPTPKNQYTFDLSRVLTKPEKSAVFSLLMSTIRRKDGPTVSAIDLSTHTSIDVQPVTDEAKLLKAISFGNSQKAGARKYVVTVNETSLKRLVEEHRSESKNRTGE